jgi:hypothetical protein
MRIRTFASVLAVLLLGFAAPRLAAAQSSRGAYQFSFDDGYVKYAEFDAANQAGGTVGSMFYSDEASLVLQDVDGAGDPQTKYANVTLKVDFDGLDVDKNQAVMSGTVSDSNVREAIGKRVLLTVEDNGDNTRVSDKLTWGFYTPVNRTWTPSDAELKDDPGVGMRWLATDAERRDDPGVVMPRDESVTIKSFPLDAYDFASIDKGTGDILVQP